MARFDHALDWFSSIGSPWLWLALVIVAIVILFWIASEWVDRQDAKAEAQADADWERERAAEREARIAKPPPAPTIPDVVHNPPPSVEEVIQSLRKRDAAPRAKRTNKRKAAQPTGRRPRPEHRRL